MPLVFPFTLKKMNKIMWFSIPIQDEEWNYMIFNSHWRSFSIHMNKPWINLTSWIKFYDFQFTLRKMNRIIWFSIHMEDNEKILWFSIHMNKPWINLTRFWDCSWCTLLESLALQLTCCCGDDIDWQLSADLIRGDGAAVFARAGQLGTWVWNFLHWIIKSFIYLQTYS